MTFVSSGDTLVCVDPVGISDIAERMGFKEIAVRKWRERDLGFPEPQWIVSGRPVWDWPEVAAWLKKTGRIT